MGGLSFLSSFPFYSLYYMCCYESPQSSSRKFEGNMPITLFSQWNNLVTDEYFLTMTSKVKHYHFREPIKLSKVCEWTQESRMAQIQLSSHCFYTLHERACQILRKFIDGVFVRIFFLYFKCEIQSPHYHFLNRNVIYS